MGTEGGWGVAKKTESSSGALRPSPRKVYRHAQRRSRIVSGRSTAMLKDGRGLLVACFRLVGALGREGDRGINLCYRYAAGGLFKQIRMIVILDLSGWEYRPLDPGPPEPFRVRFTACAPGVFGHPCPFLPGTGWLRACRPKPDMGPAAPLR